MFLKCLPLLFCLSFLPVPITAHTGPLPVSSVVDVKLISEGSPPSFSPDGQRIAYAVRRNLHSGAQDSRDIAERWECFGLVWYGTASDIMITDVGSGKTSDISGAQNDNWLPAWSPDGNYVAFLSDRDGRGSAKLWVWASKTGELRKISDAIIRGQQIEWSPDSRTIITTVRQQEYNDKPCRHSVSGTERSNVLIYESGLPNSSAPSLQNSQPWSLESHARDLAAFDIDSGKLRLLSRGKRIEWFELSPDGSRVAFTVPERFERTGVQQIRYDLDVVDVGTGKTIVVAPDIQLYLTGRAVSWSPDGTWLAFQAGGPLAQNGDIYRANADGSGVRCLAASSTDGDSPDLAPVVDHRSKQVYFLRDGTLRVTGVHGEPPAVVAQIPGHSMLQIVAKRGEFLSRNPTILVLAHNDTTKEDGFFEVNLSTHTWHCLLEDGWSYSRDYQQELLVSSNDGSSLVFEAQNSQHPPDLWIADAEFRHLRRLTHLNPGLNADDMGEAKLVHWRSLDGDELAGALLLPTHYTEGIRYPLIVWLYGGRFLSQDINNFGIVGVGEPYNLQLFAARGYAVFAPDAPQHLGTPMLDLAKAVLPGIEKIVEMGIADSKRVGVLGQSYGGYGVLSLIVQTGRFRAAAMTEGFGNLIGYYGEMGSDGSSYGIAVAESGQGLMGGEFWKYRDRYVENSPIFYLDRIETPLLIVHGENDTTVAPFLADQIFVMLRRLGKPVVYAKYRGEDHAPYDWTTEHQLDLGNRLIKWFDGWLRPEPGAPGKASQVRAKAHRAHPG